jgi:nucleoside-diphosphate-sugar epimerase
MNILITGIHGFVGNNLVAALKNNHRIFGLDIVTPQKEDVLKTFTWNELDSIPEIDIIIHLAGKAHDTKNESNAQAYFDINTGLTQKMYDWYLKSSAVKFIFFSSVKAAADRVDGVLTEDIVTSPKGPYGESKMAAENYLINRQSAVGSQQSLEGSEQSADSNQQLTVSTQQKKIYILRPCMIHGPGNKGNLNLLYQVVKKGIPYPLGGFENRRSFTSIDNLSFVIGKLIEKDIPAGIYNVGDDETLSTNELIALMAKTMKKPIRIWKWNKNLIQFFANIGNILHLPLNSERLQKLTENYIVSNVKLKKALGIDKMPVAAKEGFEKTIESFKNQ